MFTRTILSLVVVLGITGSGLAQTPWQFRWQKGQVLNYRIKLTTSVVEMAENSTFMSSSKLDLVNRWQITDMDDKGIATLAMSIVSMRQEQTLTDGTKLFFDSEDLDKSTPQLREQMKKYVGATHAVVRLDGYGRVIEVKQGSAATFEVEPPFVVVFPAANAAVGQAWRRPFTLVLEPPFGAGEKFEAEQRYDCKKIETGRATIGVATSFKTMPDNARDKIPLMQKDVQGELVVDLKAGRLLSVALNIDKMVENHQGKGSSYRYQSQYTRQLID